ncbi:MAG: ribonuclease J [Mycoplasma sp.]|nr:ribonuclease J [Mycoplasma sp.]
MANIKIFALGGNDEKGKNCYSIDVNNEIYIMDIGAKIPPVSVLGIDLIIPNFKYIQENKNRIKGIFISQAHDDSFASLPWLLMQVQGLTIYASKYTLEVIKDRVSKYKISHSNFTFKEISETIKFKSSSITPIPLSSSIHGTLGFNISTEDGSILYLKSFVLGRPLETYGKTDLNKIMETVHPKGVLSLLLDSSRSNFLKSSSNNVLVTPYIENFFNKVNPNNRIIIVAYDENTSFIYENIKLAIKNNRPVIFFGRNFAKLYEIAMKQNLLKINPQIVSHMKIKNTDNAVIFVTGQVGRLYQRIDRIMNNKDVFLKYKKTDNTIIIAPPVNGQERQYTRMMDNIVRFAPKLLEAPEKKLYSWNPTRDDISEIVKTLKPKFLLPINGLYRYLITTKYIADEVKTNTRKVILSNGRILEIKDSKFISENKKVKNINDVIVDGFGIGDISPHVINERKNLSRFGLVMVTTFLDKKNKIINGPKLQMNGVINLKSRPGLKDMITSKVIQVIEEFENDFKAFDVQTKIKKALRKLFSKEIGKEPIIVPIFYNI